MRTTASRRARSSAGRGSGVEIELCDLQKKIPLPRRQIKRRLEWVVAQVDSKHPKKLPRRIDFVFLDAKAMTQVHETFMRDPTPTDVITFQHGEIVICPEVARIQARQFRKKFNDEVLLYAIHGVLHLAGYDDVNKRGFHRMKQAQERLLKAVLTKVR